MKKFLPFLVFLVIAVIGSVGAGFLWVSNDRAEGIRFAAIADDAVNRIEARLSRSMLLLEATAAFFEAREGAVSAESFAVFATQLDLGTRHEGIAGLGFAPLMEERDWPAVAESFRANYGVPVEPWPENSGLPFAAPVAILESTDSERPPAIGFDMYSEASQRVAMVAAAQDRAARATTVRRLVGPGGEGTMAFVVYAPIYVGTFGIEERIERPQVPTGFVFAGFHAGELLAAALEIPPQLPIHMQAHEGPAAGEPIYTFGAPPSPTFGDAYAVTRQIDVANQTWTLHFRPTEAYRPSATHYLALILGAVSLLFAAALAASIHAQSQAHTATEELAHTMERNLFEKDLMLQEMKHRIKNSLARILAMARHTAARAASVEAFAESFTQRLQAMANAQDMLTRSKYQRADLRELLEQELAQVFGEAVDAVRLSGPAVSLDEATTQALGLTFHELATNALKYGGRSNGGPAIEVEWQVRQDDGGRMLAIAWRESGSERLTTPEKAGFGTKLIDANVCLELRGEIERDYRPDGLHLDLRIPLGRRPGPAARR